VSLGGRPSGRGARALNPGAWLFAPALACLLASLLLAAPLRVFGLALPEPVFAVLLAFSWALLRPSLLAPFALLGTGLLLDLLWGAPLGLWALSLLLTYAAVLTTRPLISGQSPLVTFFWYVGATLFAFACAYVFTMLDARVRPSLWAVGSQVLFTALLYPVVGRVIDRLGEADVRYR
jgi:rod shape-determining protein MreD